MTDPQTRRVETALKTTVDRSMPLAGGCIGDVRRLDLQNGQQVVAKFGNGHTGLALEGWMLTYLKANSGLPVPEVLHAEDDLLVMTYIDSGEGLTPAAEEEAADHLAGLHAVTGPRFGLEQDTLIGGLLQPNPEIERWLDFFAEHRLIYMGRQALTAGRLPAATMARIETLSGRLGRWLEEPAAPQLIHGDMWTGNVLCKGGRIAGFVDPAIYYADAEIELAFSTLFGTFGDRFFARYQEHRRMRPGFFEVRRDLYNLYPLLVHVRLFGSGYTAQVESILTRLGV